MFGTELAKDVWDRTCKKCVVDQLLFLLPNFSAKNNIKILQFKIELFLEAFSH
jgi:hypothetical protein